MNSVIVSRVISGVLVILIGAAIAAGGFQLWRAPTAWHDVVAGEATTRRVSLGLMVMAALLAIVGIATVANVPWSSHAAAAAVIIVVLAAFWVNHLLFGGIRPLHMVTNVVVALVILALLWFGNGGQAR